MTSCEHYCASEGGLRGERRHTRLSIVVAPTVLIRWIAIWIRKKVRTRDSMVAGYIAMVTAVTGVNCEQNRFRPE